MTEPIYCAWEASGDVFRCPVCGATSSNPRVRMTCPAQNRSTVERPPAPGPCVHRGGEIGRVVCPSCCGHVELKLFACSELGRCALDRRAAGVPICGPKCEQYEAVGSSQ